MILQGYLVVGKIENLKAILPVIIAEACRNLTLKKAKVTVNAINEKTVGHDNDPFVLVLNLLNLGKLTLEEVASCSGLTVKRVQTLAKML